MILLNGSPERIQFRLPDMRRRGMWAELVYTARSEHATIGEEAVDLESVRPTRILIELANQARHIPALSAALKSGTPSVAMPRIRAEHPGFAARLDEYIDRYGDRVMGELKLETVTVSKEGAPAFAVARKPKPAPEAGEAWTITQPVQALADEPNGLALLDAMEAEHAVIDPMLAAIDTALADRDSGPQRLGELTDALALALRGHLRHEEVDGLPLIDATITEEQWAAFGVGSGQRIAGDLHRYFPWMLDGATPEVTTAVLGRLPPPVQQAYRDEWQPG